MNIVFISYGLFENNSAYHITGFAERLHDRGHAVGFIAAGVFEGNKDKIVTGAIDHLDEGDVDPRLASLLDDRSTLIHAWTPRETVRRTVQKLAARGLRYVVHLEDDERLVTAAHLNVRPDALDQVDERLLGSMPGHISHPRLSIEFMQQASGMTVITDSLLRDVREGVPAHLLEPGVDTEVFRPRLTEAERSSARESYGIPRDATLLTYHGNAHRNNERDMFSLYTAIRILRWRGVDVRLVRTGEPERPGQSSTDYRNAEGVLHLGFVGRSELPRLLDIADMYVQPGWTTPFNVRRFPSKVPEFLAMGRPVILPDLNIGRRLTDGENAIVLATGGARAIVDAICRLRNDKDLARRIGQGGSAFAIEHMDWNPRVTDLEDFYGSLG